MLGPAARNSAGRSGRERIRDDTLNDTRPGAFAEHPVFAKRYRGGKSLTSEEPFGLRDGCAGLRRGGMRQGAERGGLWLKHYW